MLQVYLVDLKCWALSSARFCLRLLLCHLVNSCFCFARAAHHSSRQGGEEGSGGGLCCRLWHLLSDRFGRFYHPHGFSATSASCMYRYWNFLLLSFTRVVRSFALVLLKVLPSASQLPSCFAAANALPSGITHTPVAASCRSSAAAASNVNTPTSWELLPKERRTRPSRYMSSDSYISLKAALQGVRVPKKTGLPAVVLPYRSQLKGARARRPARLCYWCGRQPRAFPHSPTSIATFHGEQSFARGYHHTPVSNQDDSNSRMIHRKTTDEIFGWTQTTVM